MQGLVVAAVFVAAVVVPEGLAVGLMPVATGLGDVRLGLEPCYRAYTRRCKAWLLLLLLWVTSNGNRADGLAAGLIHVATGLGELLLGLEPCYRAYTCRCKAWLLPLSSWVTAHGYRDWLKGSFQWLQVFVYAAVVIK